MESTATKEIILREALSMFAAQGYAAVSMRDIAQRAGIQASSIYHYFPGKQALFEALTERADEVKRALQGAFLQAFARAERVGEDAFVQAGEAFLTGYLQNEKVEPLLRVLESERFHDEAVESTWRELMFSAPLEHETRVFEALLARGEVAGRDARELAEEYHGIILMSYFAGDAEGLGARLRGFYRRVFRTEGGDKA